MQPLSTAREVALAQAWRVLERRLRLSQGFAFFPIIVSDAALVQPLKARLEAWMRSHDWAWAEVALAKPDEFAERSLLSLFAQLRAKPARLAWFEAHRGAVEAGWIDQRRELFSRLNERRGRLEGELKGALLLLLPEGGEREAARFAPDLWHVRGLSLLLESEAADVVPGLESVAMAAAVSTGGPEAPGLIETRWREQWQLLFGDVDVNELHAEDHRLQSLSPWDGFAAVDEARRAGRLETARELADLLLALVRMRQSGSESQAGELSAALDTLGRVAAAQGDWVKAESVFRESLTLSRHLVGHLGGTPEALRDLSVSLDNLGRVAEAQGDWAQAESVYRESLMLSRQLVERLGRTPEALDDLAVSLLNMASLPAGDPAARAEALRIRETLVQRYPDVKRYADALTQLRADNPTSTPPAAP